MSTTTYYNLNKPTGTDLVNPLTDTFPNWDIVDAALHELDERSIANCTELVSLGVHAISRLDTNTKFLKWIATANYTAGETFTVDGNLVSAATPAGAALTTDAYVTGSVVLACLNADNSALTIFVSGTTMADDSAKLGGELPSYYATASDLGNTQTTVTNIDNLMGNTSIAGIGGGTVTGAISDIDSRLATETTNRINNDATKAPLLTNAGFITLNTSVSYNSSFTATTSGLYVIEITGSSSANGQLFIDSARSLCIGQSAGATKQNEIVPLKAGSSIYTRNSSSTSYKVIGYQPI